MDLSFYKVLHKYLYLSQHSIDKTIKKDPHKIRDNVFHWMTQTHYNVGSLVAIQHTVILILITAYLLLYYMDF